MSFIESVSLLSLFEYGFQIIPFEYDLTHHINNMTFEVDRVETDIEVAMMTPQEHEYCISLFQPIINDFTPIFGTNPKLNIHISRKCHYKSKVFHTDYYDRLSDFFILFYPIEWDPDNGGKLQVGKQDLLLSKVEVLQTITPSLYNVVIINNMNPLFVHQVLPTLVSDETRYLGCLEITRGVFNGSDY